VAMATDLPSRGGLSELRRLAGQPLWWRWTAASFLGRLPLTMALLALVLAGEHATGSLAVGALLAGTGTLAAALAAPLRGRRLDRRELRGGLRRACVATGAANLALAGAVVFGAPLPVLFVLAAVHGVAVAAVSGGFRALLVAVVPGSDLARANTVEAVLIEVGFIAGPALAGVVALVGGAPSVLVVMGAVALGAALLAGGLPALDPPAVAPTGAPWRIPAAAAVYGIALALGLAVGMFEAVLPSRADELGRAAAEAGPLLALTAVGSAIGGVLASMLRDPRGHLVRRAVVLLAAFGVLLVPLGLVGSVGALAVALLACGVPVAPLNALGAWRLQEAVPRGRQGEGFAVYVAAILLGAGLGQTLAGALLPVVGARLLLSSTALPPLVAAATVALAMLRSRRQPRRRPGAMA
jgi:MFS family permease